jgi:hypothetical protein
MPGLPPVDQTVRLQLVTVAADGTTRPLDPDEFARWQYDRAVRRRAEAFAFFWGGIAGAAITATLTAILLRVVGA